MDRRTRDIVSLIATLVGSAVVFAILLVPLYFVEKDRMAKEHTNCLAHGGARIEIERGPVSCWREDGTRVWLD